MYRLDTWPRARQTQPSSPPLQSELDRSIKDRPSNVQECWASPSSTPASRELRLGSRHRGGDRPAEEHRHAKVRVPPS